MNLFKFSTVVPIQLQLLPDLTDQSYCMSSLWLCFYQQLYLIFHSQQDNQQALRPLMRFIQWNLALWAYLLHLQVSAYYLTLTLHESHCPYLCTCHA
jgi:hypothetical protein